MIIDDDTILWALMRGSLVRSHLQWLFRNFEESKRLFRGPGNPEIRGRRSTSGFEEFPPQWFLGCTDNPSSLRYEITELP